MIKPLIETADKCAALWQQSQEATDVWVAHKRLIEWLHAQRDLARQIVEVVTMLGGTAEATAGMIYLERAGKFRRPAHYDSPDNNAWTRANLGMLPEPGDPEEQTTK